MDAMGCLPGSDAIPKYGLWDQPIPLMATFGTLSFLETVFLDERFARKVMRTQALAPAIRAGRLGVVQFVLDPKWGPVDFVESTLVQEDLVEGMLRSVHVNFATHVLASFRSYSTFQDSLITEYPDIDGLFDGVAAGSPQRVDVARWLLTHGVTVRIPQEPRQRVDTRPSKTPVSAIPAPPVIPAVPAPPVIPAVPAVPIVLAAQAVQAAPANPAVPAPQTPNAKEVPLPLNLLRRAVMTGNEKIVRLLLDHGADPNATDLDILEQAVKRGRLDITRMLMQAGAGKVIEATLERPRSSQKLMEHALASENVELCRYLSPLWDYA